jgi:hypothetical protein
MRLLIILSALFFNTIAIAEPTAPQVRSEIHLLLSKLQTSGCEFDRNGSWYRADEAKGHLLRKLEHIEGKRVIQSAEQFIELAAAKSSSSGKAYQVKCGNEPTIESKAWFIKQLDIIRVADQKGK